MDNLRIELDWDLVALLNELRPPATRAIRELIVLGLYREGQLSSGRGAELLGLTREDFIRDASAYGIPYFQLTGDDLRAEMEAIRDL